MDEGRDYMKRLPLIFLAAMVMIFPMGISAAVAYEKEIKNLSTALSENIQKAGKKSVAVADFTDLQGNITELGRFIAEELSVDLTNNSQGFEIADRAHLKTLLAEHKLSVSGLVDPNTVKKLGQIAGVDAIVLGTFIPFGDSIRLSCKVIATDTAKIIGATKGDIAKTSAIEELLGKGIDTDVPKGGVSEKPKSEVKASIPVSHQVEQLDNIRVELIGCKISGNAVTCSMILTNLDKDKYFWISGSRIINDTGEEFRKDRTTIGGKETTASVLVTNVPVKSSLIFYNVSPETNILTLLEPESNQNSKVQFRNIPVVKAESTMPAKKGKKR